MSWWPFSNKKEESHEFVREYLAKNSYTIPPIRSISQLDFVVLDTETSGFDTATDFVLSFGALRISNQVIHVSSAVEWYPESDTPGSKSTVVHGLVERKNQVSAQQFTKDLLSYIGSSILVGHHVGFDLAMLQKITKPFGLQRFRNPILDTMNLCIRLDHGPQVDHNYVQMEDYSLDALCDRFHIPLDDRHTAAGDAHLTGLLLLKLLKIAEAKGIGFYGKLVR